MTITFDTHTHTLMSGHAYSTLEENVAACVRSGMEGFAITDHGPAMEGAPRPIYFMNLTALPREIDGIRILRGAEANIVGFDGRLDLPDSVLKRLDVCVASYHEICLRPGSPADHTAAWLAVLKNPYVDIVGHSGRGPYPYDLEAVMAACRQQDKLIEINNHSLKDSANDDTCREIAVACRQYGVKIVVNSDAHLSRQIGQVQNSLKLLAAIDFPPDLIVNKTYAEFRTWLMNRKPWLTGL